MPIQELGHFNRTPQKTVPGTRANRGPTTRSASNHKPEYTTYGNLSKVLSPNGSHKVREETGRFTVRTINFDGSQAVKITPVGRSNHHKR